MKKSILIALLLSLAGASFTMSSFAQQPTPNIPPKPEEGPKPIPAPPVLGAKNYVLMDFNSNLVLVNGNSDARVEPASITKVMTTYVVFRELADGDIKLEDTVTVSEHAWRAEGSRMFIDPTMSPTVADLLRGIIIQSGNDACIALAEHIAGTETAFAELMNHYAEALGMVNTHFENSTGLPHENHYSSAHDIAILSAAIIRDFPQYYPGFAEKEFTFNGIRQHNRNTLLWRDEAIDGLKTGHTETAGYCLAASALREGMRLISVVMGSESETARASETQSLLNYGFRFYETVQLYEAGSELAKGRVWKGEVEEVGLGLATPLFVTIPRGRYNDLDGQVELQPELSAPLAANTTVGTITVKLGEEIVAQRDLVTLAEVVEAGFFGRTWDSLRLWSGSWFSDDEEAEENPDAGNDADSGETGADSDEAGAVSEKTDG